MRIHISIFSPPFTPFWAPISYTKWLANAARIGCSPLKNFWQTPTVEFTDTWKMFQMRSTKQWWPGWTTQPPWGFINPFPLIHQCLVSNYHRRLHQLHQIRQAVYNLGSRSVILSRCRAPIYFPSQRLPGLRITLLWDISAHIRVILTREVYISFLDTSEQ